MSQAQKTVVIFGLANKRSIAWAIAQKLYEAGWRLAITYQNERLEQEAKDLLADLDRGDFRAGEQTQHRVGDRAETVRSWMAIGDHLPERAAGAGSERPAG